MKYLLAIFATLMVSLAAYGQDPWTRISEGDIVPDFSVVMTDGTEVSTVNFEGKVVWITLWASWCPSCRKEFKRLMNSDEFWTLMVHEDFLFLPIAREENLATVIAWLSKKGYNIPSGVDPDRKVYELFAEQNIPRNIIVERDGVVTHHSSAYSKKALRELIERVKEMLN